MRVRISASPRAFPQEPKDMEVVVAVQAVRLLKLLEGILLRFDLICAGRERQLRNAVAAAGAARSPVAFLGPLV
jgi:hypothetical protein